MILDTVEGGRGEGGTSSSGAGAADRHGHLICNRRQVAIGAADDGAGVWGEAKSEAMLTWSHGRHALSRRRKRTRKLTQTSIFLCPNQCGIQTNLLTGHGKEFSKIPHDLAILAAHCLSDLFDIRPRPHIQIKRARASIEVRIRIHLAHSQSQRRARRGCADVIDHRSPGRRDCLASSWSLLRGERFHRPLRRPCPLSKMKFLHCLVDARGRFVGEGHLLPMCKNLRPLAMRVRCKAVK